MAKKVINVGTNANPTGDSLKNAFTKVNDNFTELYNALGLTDGSVNVGAFEFSGSTSGIATMTTTDSSAILIDQTVTVGSNLTVGGDILPSVANGGDLGSSAKPWRSLYVSNSTIYLGGTALAVNQSGQLTVGGVAANTSNQLVNATDKIVLNEEGATRLSMYLNNVEKTRLQINGNDLLLSSLAGGVVLAATDGVGGEWRFKTNGNLESTGGNFLSAAETPAVFGSLNSTSTGASSGTVTLKSGTGNVDGGSIYIEAGTGGSGNDGEVAIRTSSGPYEWLFDNGGNLTIPGEIRHSTTNNWLDLNLAGGNVGLASQTGSVGIYADYAGGPYTWLFKDNGSIQFPDMSLQTTAYTGTANLATVARNIENEGDVNITVNLTDSTKRIWLFGEDGNLTFPDGTNQSTGWTGGINDTNSYVNFSTYPPMPGTIMFANGSVQTEAFTGYANTAGIAYSAYNIDSENNVSITVNLTDSTKRIWQFGEDGVLNLAGNLQFSDGTVQTTATPTELTPFIRSGVITSGASFSAYGITIAMSGTNPYTITAAIGAQVGGDSRISSPNYTGGISTTPTSIFTITATGQSCIAIISDVNTFAIYRVTVHNMIVNDPNYELTMVAIEQLRSTAYDSGGPI